MYGVSLHSRAWPLAAVAAPADKVRASTSDLARMPLHPSGHIKGHALRGGADTHGNGCPLSSANSSSVRLRSVPLEFLPSLPPHSSRGTDSALPTALSAVSLPRAVQRRQLRHDRRRHHAATALPADATNVAVSRPPPSPAAPPPLLPRPLQHGGHSDDRSKGSCSSCRLEQHSVLEQHRTAQC